MIPDSILGQLRGYRNREATLRLFWGAAAWLAIALVMLGIACLIDRQIDRVRETPTWLRWAMTGTQVAVNLVTFYLLVLRPLTRLPSLVALATAVERRVPEFRHRLVTAFQLNRDTADRRGVSPVMLDEVTREAEQIAGRHRFATFADHRRIGRGLGVALPPVALLAAALLAWPELSAALLARQALLDREIPRSVRIASVTPEVWPGGEEVRLSFEITDVDGPVDPGMTGTVLVWQEGQPLQRLRLTHAGSAGGAALFAATVPPSSEPFTYRAFLGDGRMAEPGGVVFEPRPVVTRLQGWVRLPEFVGLRPDGTPYERPMDQGEILGRPGSPVRVRVETQKPIAEATLVLLSRTGIGSEEVEHGREPMRLDGEGAAEGTFTLAPELTAYRIEVADRHGFANAAPPRRNVATTPDEPPYVSLLPERFPPAFGGGLTEEAEVDGLPVLLGGPIRIGYYARSPLGLGRAELVYRVNGGPERRLPLNPVRADENLGEFDIRQGGFERMSFRDTVEFYSLPSANPDLIPGGLEAGGRFDFRTSGVEKSVSGGFSSSLEVGDEIEFAVQVYDRHPDARRPPGRSETRTKTIVNGEEFAEWIQSLLATEDRLRRLRENQQSVFGSD